VRVAGQFEREARAGGTALAIDVRPGTVVESDPEMLTIVLQNLVGNAVKYGGGGGEAGGTIHIGGTACDGGGGAVWVTDDGPGIARETVGRIFEAFARGEVRGQPGVGLGLAIASQAARLLAAELTVDSTLGAGSTFRLTLPPPTGAVR
jgi:signal transduction histidine kinase